MYIHDTKGGGITSVGELADLNYPKVVPFASFYHIFTLHLKGDIVMFEKEKFFKELKSLKSTIVNDMNADELYAIVESYHDGGIFTLIDTAFLCGYSKGKSEIAIN